MRFRHRGETEIAAEMAADISYGAFGDGNRCRKPFERSMIVSAVRFAA